MVVQGAEVRLIAGSIADGVAQAGLEIRLAPHWKTYWRYPGDAGVPPQHELTVPFVRMLGGPLDFHQGGFRGVAPEAYEPSYLAPKNMWAGSNGSQRRACGRSPVISRSGLLGA